MNETPACKHGRTRLVAKDNDAEYVECLDCGALLEAGEVREAPRADPAGFDESLSDA
jgi:Zn ribbon nucleic-acid-binding protein